MSLSSACKELYSIREWAPMTEIIEKKIPPRLQRGLFPTNLNITCVDAIADFLALGSDAGIVFWYNRQTGEMQKLKAELTTRITCVKIVDSVEYMIAAGSSTGQVSVFQIQKEVPPDLNLVAPCTRAKPIERYTIRELHHCNVSCVEWSKNGMKLYSGDRQGVVVLTEFDYQSHLSKSMEILSESYEIVQLSVHQSYLLVSTLYRCIVCQRNEQTAQWRITQIGKKDRKQLIDCGGIFLKQQTAASNKPLLICGRPGWRFWLANIDGNVEKTLLFKDAVLRSPTWEIPILNPKHLVRQQTDAAAALGEVAVSANNFRIMYLYGGQDTLLVTHDDTTLYILNVDRLRVEAVARGFRKILDFCVCDKEIFVLEGERSLLRLAPMPEKPNRTAKVIFNPLLPPPVPILGASVCGSFESPVEFEPEEQPVISAEECFELPPIEKLDLNVPIELAVESPLAEQNRRLELFRQIGEMDFEQSILHTSGITNTNGRNKKRKPKLVGIVEIGHETKEAAAAKINGIAAVDAASITNKATLMDASYCNLENNGATTPLDMKAAYTKHLPDALSPDTLQKTIAAKAKTLAAELEIPELNLAPLTAEELRVSQACAAPPPLQPPAARNLTNNETTANSTFGLQNLAHCYPTTNSTSSSGTVRQLKEEACVQTTPTKKIYYIEETRNIAATTSNDYSTGEPVDGICAALRATNLILNDDNDTTTQDIKKRKDLEKPAALKFVTAAPAVAQDYNSFLPDFRRARDPLRKNSEPQSSDSNTSGEWEFLDN